MMKNKAEVVKAIEDAMDMGAEAIFSALKDGGALTDECCKDEGGEMGDEPTEESESDEYKIDKKTSLPEARGIAVKFAMGGMGKGKDEKSKPPMFGKM